MKVYVSDRLIFSEEKCKGTLQYSMLTGIRGGDVVFGLALKGGQYVKVTTTDTDVEFRVDE